MKVLFVPGSRYLPVSHLRVSYKGPSGIIQVNPEYGCLRICGRRSLTSLKPWFAKIRAETEKGLQVAVLQIKVPACDLLVSGDDLEKTAGGSIAVPLDNIKHLLVLQHIRELQEEGFNVVISNLENQWDLFPSWSMFPKFFWSSYWIIVGPVKEYYQDDLYVVLGQQP